jgi:hypothetical protein
MSLGENHVFKPFKWEMSVKEALVMKRFFFLIIILGFSLVVSANSIFEFSGYVDSINYNENNVIDVTMGQQLTGWFSYEIVPDLNSNTSVGEYFQDNASMSMTLGTETVEYLNDFVYLRTYDQSTDNFSFMVDSTLPGYAGIWMHIILDDSTGTVFSSDALPTSLELAEFDSARFVFAGNKFNNDQYDSYYIQGDVTDLVAVPEPTTLTLLTLGGMLIRKRK